MCEFDPPRRRPWRRLPGALSRRAAMAAGVLGALLGRSAARAAPSSRQRPAERAVVHLLERAARANAAFVRGDAAGWFQHVRPIADDFTLMQPFGGPPSRGFEATPARLAELSRYFRNGVTRSETVATYASDDLVVLVLIERQQLEVGDLPSQPWSLRVTQVYRRRGEHWEYVHRHADPLVRNIGLEPAAALARGEPGD